jgi:hypothetical protein
VSTAPRSIPQPRDRAATRPLLTDAAGRDRVMDRDVRRALNGLPEPEVLLRGSVVPDVTRPDDWATRPPRGGSCARRCAAWCRPRDCLIVEETRVFSALGLARSRAGREARRLKPTRVAVLWTHPDGVGFENVNRAALTLSPRGFLAVTPDGTVRPARASRVAGREITRVAWSAFALAVVTVGLAWPAAILRGVRR